MTVALDDPAVAARIRAREPEALEAVVSEYLPQIVRAARGAGLRKEEAEDVAHATFVTFLEKAGTFEGRSHVRTWLFGILFHKMMEMRRVAERERQTDDIDEVMESRFDADAASSVAAASGEHDDCRISPTGAEEIDGQHGQAPAGVFHHLQEIRTSFFHRNPIDLAHLLRSDSGDDRPFIRLKSNHRNLAFAGRPVKVTP